MMPAKCSKDWQWNYFDVVIVSVQLFEEVSMLLGDDYQGEIQLSSSSSAIRIIRTSLGKTLAVTTSCLGIGQDCMATFCSWCVVRFCLRHGCNRSRFRLLRILRIVRLLRFIQDFLDSVPPFRDVQNTGVKKTYKS